MSQESPPGLTPEESNRLALRARLGMLVLGARTLVLQGLVLGANVLLARVLSPGDFGIFAIVQFAVALFTLFGDVGLGGALIQQKTPPTERELSTVFWVQTSIVVAVISVVWIAAPFAHRLWPKLPEGASWLMRALSLSLLFGFLRAVPSVLMERELQYGRLSIIELVNSLSFYVCVVLLALLKLGVWALVAGVVFQSAITLVMTFVMRPWRPRFVFEREVLGPMIRFGIPFQLKGVINFVSEAVMPLYAGSMLGQDRLGYVTWAKNTGYFPLKLVEIVGRVSFPLYSRLRADPKRLAAEVEKNIKVCLTGTFLFVGVVLALGPNLTRVVYGEKWLPAVPALYVFSVVLTIGFLSPIVGAAFDAIGEPKIFVRLSIFWTLVNWLAVLVGTPFWPERHRLLAFAVSYCVHVAVGNAAVIYVMRGKLEPIHVGARVLASAVSALVVGAIGRFAVAPWAQGVATFIVGVVLLVGLFVLLVGFLDKTARADVVALFRRRGDAPAAPAPASAEP